MCVQIWIVASYHRGNVTGNPAPLRSWTTSARPRSRRFRQRIESHVLVPRLNKPCGTTLRNMTFAAVSLVEIPSTKGMKSARGPMGLDEQIALDLRRSRGASGNPSAPSALHAFGDHRKAEALAETHHRLDDLFIVAVLRTDAACASRTTRRPSGGARKNVWRLDNDEYPVPKSSMEMLIPAAVRRSTFSCARPPRSIATVSVISMSRACTGNPVRFNDDMTCWNRSR